MLQCERPAARVEREALCGQQNALATPFSTLHPSVVKSAVGVLLEQAPFLAVAEEEGDHMITRFRPRVAAHDSHEAQNSLETSVALMSGRLALV